MLDVSFLSRRFSVRALRDTDVDAIFTLCRANTQFYEYCQAKPTREQILQDLHIAPPGFDASDKYYVGFFQQDDLIAVMDLLDGSPEPQITFIGFFMINRELQGQGLGSEIIGEAAAYLRSAGKTAIRLGIDKENPQSTHFWKKNGFQVIREVDCGEWTVLVAEKPL